MPSGNQIAIALIVCLLQLKFLQVDQSYEKTSEISKLGRAKGFFRKGLRIGSS